MRRIAAGLLSASAMAAVVGIAACRNSPANDARAMTADLERDLALATAPRVNRSAVVSAIEGGPTGAPSGTEHGKRAPVAVRKRTPQPSPSPVEQEVAGLSEAAEIPAPVLTVAVSQNAPAPTPTTEPVAVVPDHDPITDNRPASGPNAGNGDAGNDGAGNGSDGRRGRGTGIGTVIGVIIRGGAGGVDHCDPRTDGRRPRGGSGIPGGMGGIGGVIIPIVMGGGNARMPVSRSPYPRY